MEENRIQPEKFEDRIICMSMYNGIDWTKASKKETCISNSLELRRSQKDSLNDTGHSWDQELKKSGMERTHTSHTVCGITLLR